MLVYIPQWSEGKIGRLQLTGGFASKEELVRRHFCGDTAWKYYHRHETRVYCGSGEGRLILCAK